jgi:short-subunit dehydrogenase
MIELNCVAVVVLAKQLLPAMVARGKGRVLITSSVAAVMPATYSAVYGATKAFDLSFSEAIREELRDSGVTVTALQPGPTETDFFERAGLEDTKVGQKDKDDPALVARQGFEAMMRGDDKVYAGSLKSKFQGLAGEILPEPMKAKQHAKMAEPGSGRKS